MKNCLLVLLVLISITACRGRKSKRDRNMAPEVKEFFDSYFKLKLPFNAVDSAINNKARNKTISLSAFTKVIPDTVFNNPFGSDRSFILYPVGKIDEKSRESYFVTLAKAKDRSVLYLSVYDSNRHTTTIPILSNEPDDAANTASIDKKLTIIIYKEWTINNVLYYNRIILAYNNVGVFTTVLTETNEQRRTSDAAIVNPLDTFPKTNKLSGDYAKGPKKVLFIRDSKVEREYLFYLHFQNEEDEENCSGELRGILRMKSDKEGEFIGNGDPCVLNFTFKGNEVTVKENGSCGNYRDIKCFFNHTFIKKKESKPPPHKK